MEIDVISGKDTKFTDAVSLSFHGVEEATFDLFHKVIHLRRISITNWKWHRYTAVLQNVL